ncbi:MAG: DUF1971 domain-containing protein [Proteobacteria bacterium]|nr:DUF1971 domain-containing protein [Pseudomonadota bacterium]
MSKDPYENLTKYSETAVFTETTVPEKLKSRHQTKAGVWGKLVVLSGELTYIEDREKPVVQAVDPSTHAVIKPEMPHHLEVTGPVSFQVEFYRDEP